MRRESPWLQCTEFRFRSLNAPPLLPSPNFVAQNCPRQCNSAVPCLQNLACPPPPPPHHPYKNPESEPGVRYSTSYAYYTNRYSSAMMKLVFQNICIIFLVYLCMLMTSSNSLRANDVFRMICKLGSMVKIFMQIITVLIYTLQVTQNT